MIKLRRMNRKYDLVVILEPELKAEEQEKLLAKIKKTITDLKGELSENVKLGVKQLTYPISKKKEGIFVELKLNLLADKTLSFRQKLQGEEQILRYLMVAEEKEA